jgi:hypothetical protein
MIAGQPFDLLEAIYLLLVVCGLYLAGVSVCLKFGVIVKAVLWLLSAALLLMVLLWKDGPQGFYRFVQHEYRRLRHRARMRSHVNWG